MKTRFSSGFTLIEVMVTTVIIALLAALAVPSFQKIRASSQERAIVNNLRQLADASQQYFLEYGASSVTSENLVGVGRYVNRVTIVAGESYPVVITQVETRLSATGTQVSGKPTVVFDR